MHFKKYVLVFACVALVSASRSALPFKVINVHRDDLQPASILADEIGAEHRDDDALYDDRLYGFRDDTDLHYRDDDASYDDTFSHDYDNAVAGQPDDDTLSKGISYDGNDDTGSESQGGDTLYDNSLYYYM